MDYNKIWLMMENEFMKAKMSRGLDVCRDMNDLVLSWLSEDKNAAHEHNKELITLTEYMVSNGYEKDTNDYFNLYRTALCREASVDFDSYLQYIELEKPYDKKFYKPRRGYLHPVVEAYQEIADRKLQLLTVSLVKRAGKSQMGINFVNFLSGRRPDKAALMEGAGDALVKSFYKGCLEYLDPKSPYLFYDVFPDATLISTDADIKTIDLGMKSRFPTIMCRSIDATQVGLSEATNVLYLDDCVNGREEASNKQRLADKWNVIRGDVMGRAIEGTPIIACGTRYATDDVIGKLQEYAQSVGWKWKAIEIPALDPITDESNYEFEKEGEKIFTTGYFREQRDLVSDEQWDSEFQQQPMDVKGILLNAKSLNYYYDLPVADDGKPNPDAIIAVCDTAERGSDSVSMPVAYLYGTEAYIDDVVFNNGAPEYTKPECVNCIMRNKVSNALFESNNAGEYYARDVEEMLKANGYLASIETKRTISNKQTRIEMASDNIKKHFHFKHPSRYERGGEYFNFMKEVTSYLHNGKVPHDDAPDSLSLLENRIRLITTPGAEVIDRPF